MLGACGPVESINLLIGNGVFRYYIRNTWPGVDADAVVDIRWVVLALDAMEKRD